MAQDTIARPAGTAEPARHRAPSAPWRFVYEYQLRVYRRTWRGSLTTKVLTPILFLLSMGVGLGSLVNSAAGVIITVRNRPFAVMGFVVAEGRVKEIDAIADPDRVATITADILPS